MTSMIETVARAICAQMGEDPDAILAEFPRWRGWHEWAVPARAAIEAMREPTSEMVEASNREWDGRMSHRSSGAWQAMIDAALHPPVRSQEGS